MAQRLARLRRERGLTQLEVAAGVDVPQPRISQYERGELRLHGELIVNLSAVLNVSADELLGINDIRRPSLIEDRRILRRVQKMGSLSRRDQQALLRTIDAFLSKAS